MKFTGYTWNSVIISPHNRHRGQWVIEVWPQTVSTLVVFVRLHILKSILPIFRNIKANDYRFRFERIRINRLILAVVRYRVFFFGHYSNPAMFSTSCCKQQCSYGFFFRITLQTVSFVFKYFSYAHVSPRLRDEPFDANNQHAHTAFFTRTTTNRNV